MLSKCLGLNQTLLSPAHCCAYAVVSKSNRHSNAQEITKFDLGPNILKAHVIELFSSRQELWLRKAANVKEENLMAFQGR